MRHVLAVALALLALQSSAALAAECVAESRAHRVPLLELYTSEGCDSCPPADRWVSELRGRGLDTSRVVVLAFHVDYWDRLGWSDRFAQRRFSERQRLLNNRNGARVVYTPQLVLNGKDYRRGGDDAFAKHVADIARVDPKAAIRLQLKPAEDRLEIGGTWSGKHAPDAQGWLVLYENRLATEVAAGENRNKRLHHDFVVRDIAGPFPGGALAHVFNLDSRWKRADLGVAAFVQDARSGDVLQAVALGVCS